jgi:hypothetical protein
MPAGMFMKSEPYGSDFAAPRPDHDVASFCKARGLEYVHRLGPLPLARFLAYADWYIENLVPEVRDDMVTSVVPVNGGFRVSFLGSDPVVSRQVVVATGVRPYAHVPAELTGLGPDLVTHTIDHNRLDQFRGRRVAVVGAGQSALETAALLHEQGTDVRIIARGPALRWSAPNPARLSAAGHVRRPVNKLCEGWRCAFWNTPAAFRMLPREMRITKARTVLGPNGAWWLKDRVDGVIDVFAGHTVRIAAPSGSGVRLSLDGPGEPAIDVDHVIAGTGFRVDLARLPFLPDELRSSIPCLNGYPVVSRVGESAIPGLYFAGAPTAVNLGPSVRFIAGTHNVAARLARSLGRRAGLGKEQSAPPERATVV